MNRDYSDGQTASDVIYFVGPEVEKTSQYGNTTLFKVGERPFDEICWYLDEAYTKTGDQVKHVYFTANHSLHEIEDWGVVEQLLDADLYVTVEGNYMDVKRIKHKIPVDHPNLIIMISIEMPSVDEWPSGTYIKVDDIDFNATNTGVWLHRLEALLDDSVKTTWDAYKQDHILATRKDLDASR